MTSNNTKIGVFWILKRLFGKGAFEKWEQKSSQLKTIANISISNLLENKATVYEKSEVYDIGDYLLQFDLNEFRNNAKQL